LGGEVGALDQGGNKAAQNDDAKKAHSSIL
jgi:hypothetical protein